jgi:UDP-glucose 4-epimerase
VLGGSGFIGKKLVKRLCIHNNVLVADIVFSPEFEGLENVSYSYCNFTEAESFVEVLENADTVIHLVSTIFAKDGTSGLACEISLNVLSTIRLLEDMIGRNVNLLFVSSGGTVYGEGGEFSSLEDDSKHAYCGYALTKMMIEDTLELYEHQHGLSYKTIRLSNPYGFLSSDSRMQGLIPILVDRVLQGDPVAIWGDGENIRDYIYIDDAIDAIEAVIKYNGNEKLFNAGSGVGYSINEIFGLVTEKLNPKNEPVVQYQACRKCDVKKNVLSIEKIMKCTGWEPKIGIEEGIQLVIREFEKRNSSQKAE